MSSEAAADTAARYERMKHNARQLYALAFAGKLDEATSYMGAHYKQHNPLVADGKEGFREYFERMQREYPEKSVEFVRAVAEGDTVALHTHQVWPGDEHYVTMDFFRFDENEKIIEHWDAVQRVPEENKCGNPMW